MRVGDKTLRECVCVFGLRETEKPFSTQVSSYCSQNKSAIRANDAPQKALSCFPLFSCQHDSFLSTHPLPPRLSHFSVQLSPSLRPAIQQPCAKKKKKEHQNSPKFLRVDGFLQRTTHVFSFVPLLPSVLCWLSYLLGGLFSPSRQLISLLIHAHIYSKSIPPGSCCKSFCECTVWCSVPPHQADCFLSG